jgi:hypothetical protein
VIERISATALVKVPDEVTTWAVAVAALAPSMGYESDLRSLSASELSAIITALGFLRRMRRELPVSLTVGRMDRLVNQVVVAQRIALLKEDNALARARQKAARLTERQARRWRVATQHASGLRYGTKV